MQIKEIPGARQNKRLGSSPRFGGYARASMVAGAAMAAPAAALADFSNSYTVNPPPNGFYTGTNTNGSFGTWTGTFTDAGFSSVSLNTASAPLSVAFNISRQTAGPFSGLSSYTFLVQAAAAGLVTFDYSALSGGGSLAQYTVNGSSFNNLSGTGNISFNVSLGDTFGFAVRAAYGTSASLTISNFSAPVPQNGNGGGPSNGVPDTSSTLALFALGFVGLLAYRAALQRRAFAR